jgi:biotin transport system substrate-specific component
LSASDLARIAVFAAVIIVLGLPGGFAVFGAVPITAQTLGVMLAGAVLGPWAGALSVAVVLVLTAVGMPFLAGGRGGIAVFLGPSAGYALGFILGAIIIGLTVHAGEHKPGIWRTFVGMIAGGIVAIYAIGIPVQSAVTGLPMVETAVTSLIFIPGDMVKAVIATFVVMTLLRAYPQAFRRVWRVQPGAAAGHDRAMLP